MHALLRCLAIASLSVVVSAGCKRSAADDEGASKTETANSAGAAKTAASAAKVAAAKTPAADEAGSCAGKAKTAANADEAGSCGGAEMKEEAGGCNKWDDEAAEVSKRAVPTDAEWTVFNVSGMTCGGCERRVIAHLGRLEGIVAVEADAELGQVRVASAKGAKLDGSVRTSIAKLGYKVAK